MQLEIAIALAGTVHRGQTDKAGQPYILHVLSVMLRVRRAGHPEWLQIAAVLHDTLEDTTLTLDEIRRTFGEPCASVVETVTRRPDEPYATYIARIKQDPAARAVKLADLQDNLDPTRPVFAGCKRLLTRYLEALGTLSADQWRDEESASPTVKPLR